MKRIKEILFDDVKPFIRQAEKERVSFTNNNNCKWFGVFDENELKSFFCLQFYKGVVRFKSNYTIPEYRGKKSLQLSIEFAIMYLVNRGIKKMTAYCTPMSINSHLRNGAKKIWEKNGITYVEYNFGG